MTPITSCRNYASSSLTNSHHEQTVEQYLDESRNPKEVFQEWIHSSCPSTPSSGDRREKILFNTILLK